MRLLIYGFGPYRPFKDNITEKTLGRLPERKGLKKIVFPVRFRRSQFIRAVERHRPDVILGLGQSSKGRRLKIELRAVNRRRAYRGHRARAIISGGPKWLTTSLKLGRSRQARISHDAGDYVCNYSMYVILDYLRQNHLPVRFGFIHTPRNSHLGNASRLLLRVIREIQTPRSP